MFARCTVGPDVSTLPSKLERFPEMYYQVAAYIQGLRCKQRQSDSLDVKWVIAETPTALDFSTVEVRGSRCLKQPL